MLQSSEAVRYLTIQKVRERTLRTEPRSKDMGPPPMNPHEIENDREYSWQLSSMCNKRVLCQCAQFIVEFRDQPNFQPLSFFVKLSSRIADSS